VKSQIAHLPHRSLRYIESGAGKHTLVLLHAFPLSADQWLPQLYRVPAGWRFVAPDLRGFRGAGAAFEDPGLHSLSMDDYADDVIALLTQLEIRRAVIGGVSMGGYVAFGILRRAPERVSGLLLANTRAIADSDEARAGRDRMIKLLAEEGPAVIAREMLPRLLGETTRKQQPDLVEAVRRLIVMNSKEGIATALAALRDRPDSTPLLSTITVPSLIITGDEDAIIPVSETEAMRRAMPGSTMAVIPRTGHLSNLEDPFSWRKALEGWLNGMWSFD
jgi:pimeloyl-ACP methyl ester carboxylesterase